MAHIGSTLGIITLTFAGAHASHRTSAVWGAEGHRVVGHIAQELLTPAAKTAVTDLLEGSRLEDVANWADEIKSDSDYDWARPLHYINAPNGTDTFDLAEDCPGGSCVVGAIQRFSATLRDATALRSFRQEALKFLVHFVGDLHQPLHAGYAGDRGGNDITVHFFGQHRNLHQVWDTSILQRRISGGWSAYADSLVSTASDADVDYWQSITEPEDWANESLGLAIASAYPIPASHDLGADYYNRSLPVVERQLVAGGVRLAALLNGILLATPDPEPHNIAAAPEDSLTIATFNIQVFGKTKASKPEIMSTLASIIRQYDIVAVQEIKDSSEAVPAQFLTLINSADADYELLLSPRTGLQDDDAGSQEQYAYYYNTNAVESLGEGVLFDDSGTDHFQREPFLARFKAKGGSFSFVLAAIHTKPDAALEEIEALDDVVHWARTHFAGEDDFIVLGDYNASCTYASSYALDALSIRGSSYTWVIPDDADTNVNQRSQCAYDRIVLTAGANEDYAGHWGVDHAFTDAKVSDHWPVWAAFRRNADTGGL